MTATAHALPKKTRDIHNHHMNSTVWDTFTFRDGDIIIGTYAKSGTTWTQQIVSQLVFNGAEGIDVPTVSPWLDLRIMPPEALAVLETQKHRRFIKTHLPVDALVFSSKAKYIYVGRDGRDVAWSLYNHFSNAKSEIYSMLNDTPGRGVRRNCIDFRISHCHNNRKRLICRCWVHDSRCAVVCHNGNRLFSGTSRELCATS